MKGLGSPVRSKGRQETCGSPYRVAPKLGRSDDEWIRNVSNDYSKDGVPEPEMPAGFPTFGRMLRGL